MSKAHNQNRESDSHHVYKFMQDTGMIREDGDEKTRHEYKLLAEEKGLTTSAERSSVTPLTHSETIKSYAGTLKEFRHFARVEGFGNNLRTLPAEAVKAFCNHKVIDDGCGRQRVQDILSVINKAGYFGNNENLNQGVTEYRRDVVPKIPRNIEVSRAFQNPQAVISCLRSPGASLAAEIQLRTGLRAGNALKFHINEDGKTVSFVSKGGMPHEAFSMPQDLIDRARAFSDSSGNVSIMPYRSYEYQIKAAASYLGERVKVGDDKYKTLNSHAFRHSFGKSLYEDCRSRGMSHNEARGVVSEALFHSRLEIADVYIR